MGLGDDKKGIFTEIAALKSAGQNATLPNLSNSLSSITNFRDPIPMMMDMGSTLAGSDAPKKIFGQVITEVKDMEGDLKEGLTDQMVDHNSDQDLPSGFTETGISVPVSDIDSQGTLGNKADDNNLINGTEDNYENAINSAIDAPDTEIVHNNQIIKYDSATDSIITKPANSGLKKGQLISSIIAGMVIISVPILTAKIMDLLFGTLSKNKNRKQLLQEAKIQKTLQKVINEEDDITISDDELRDLEELADLRAQGKGRLDVGCSIVDVELSESDLSDLIDTVSNTNDPKAISDAFENAFFNSIQNEDQKNENRDAMRDGFFKLLIQAIVLTIVMGVTTSPQVRGLLAMVLFFKTGVAQLGNVIDDLKGKRTFVDCMASKSKSIVNEIIFGFIKTLLLGIIIPVATIIIAEKIKQFIGLLKSLVARKPA